MKANVRKFNGKAYRLHSYEHRKFDAQFVAKNFRKRGKDARVIKDSSGPGYYIYVR